MFTYMLTYNGVASYLALHLRSCSAHQKARLIFMVGSQLIPMQTFLYLIIAYTINFH